MRKRVRGKAVCSGFREPQPQPPCLCRHTQPRRDAVKLEDFAEREPRFILEEFFSGTLRGWGVTIGRLGGFQNRFTIDARGRFDPEANVLSLTEDYFFDDGHSDTLTWTILKREENRYEGRETLIDGVAEGDQAGSAFRWQYARDVPDADGAKTRFGFDDWFILHDEKHMSVHASLTKLGVEVATIEAFYERVG
ncbi:DUF3833 domain-containing protein [Rhizobium sp. TH135]|nr:DUF3833 domain-containing protein [Rhizobium sp. TH135]